MSRRLMMSNSSGGGNLGAGLVFYASLREALIAETGQHLSGNWELDFDSDLNRHVGGSVEGTSLHFDIEGLPAGNESFTMAGWFKADFNTATLLGWGKTPFTPTDAAFCALTNFNGGNLLSMPVGNADQDYSISAPARLNQWYHLCGTHDEATGKNIFYVNGAKVGESTKELTVGTFGAAIGCFWSNQAGNISAAEVRIYNRVLSAAEAKTLAKIVR